MSDTATQAKATALAGGAIASALLETLFDKGVLSLDESRSVLDRAIRSLGLVMQSPEGLSAANLIGALQRGKFSARP
jgi:hypothetical protein